MKYLKKFNEELKPRTYLSAAKKLKAIGHTDRAKALEDWAEETEKRGEIVKWKDNLQDYALFGTYKIKPQRGKLVIFPASWTHPYENCIPISEDKYVICGWIYSNF